MNHVMKQDNFVVLGGQQIVCNLRGWRSDIDNNYTEESCGCGGLNNDSLHGGGTHARINYQCNHICILYEYLTNNQCW